MKNIIITTSAIFGMLFVSCESKTYDEVATETNPTYSKNIKPLLQSKCTTCHSPSTATSQEPYLTTLDEVKTAILNYNLACLINDPTQCSYPTSTLMPPTGRMPQANIDMINLWITNNYPN